MKRNNIIQNIQSFKLPLMRVLLVLGIFSTLISCEMEDDIPPPSAYVAPEPVEGCVQIEGVPELSEGINFECEYPEFGTFGGTDAGTITVDPVDNPFKEGINTSDKVIMVTQTAEVEGWAGLFFNLASKIDFSEEQTIKVKVYSPAAGQTVLLKMEDSSDGSINKEVSTTTTVAEKWEELSFTFSPGDSDKFERMVLFFNFNGDKDATTAHYFDDIVLGEAGPAEDPMKLPVTFDDPLVNYNVAPFGAEGTAFEIVANPELSGSNDTESLVGAVTKTGAAYEGITYNLSEALNLSGDSKTLSVKVYSEVAYTVLLKLETGVNDERSNEVDADHGGTGWETLTFDFASDATTSYQSDSDPGGDAIVPNGQYDQFSLFLDLAGSAAGTFYVDDLVHMGGDGGTSATEPQSAAPTPTVASDDVISLFSDAYTDVTVDTWRTDWSSVDYTETTIAGDNVKLYSNLDFVGIETVSNQVDASSMTHFHLDYWSGNASVFRVKLVDFGADGGFEGGDDTVDEIEFTVTPNTWVSLDIPLSDFAELTNTEHISQFIFSATPAGGANVYIDNVYFYKETAASAPQSAAPTPTVDASNVISLFSDAYTDVTVDTWRTDWSSVDYTETTIAGDNVKLYSNLDFVGIETVSNQVDASSMTHFHVDYWTGNASVFRVKLVDFGADGGFEGGDDTEDEIEFTVTPNTWVSLDIPLSDFAGLTSKEHMSQFIFSAAPAGGAKVYMDNVYFHN